MWYFGQIAPSRLRQIPRLQSWTAGRGWAPSTGGVLATAFCCRTSGRERCVGASVGRRHADLARLLLGCREANERRAGRYPRLDRWSDTRRYGDGMVVSTWDAIRRGKSWRHGHGLDLEPGPVLASGIDMLCWRGPARLDPRGRQCLPPFFRSNPHCSPCSSTV